MNLLELKEWADDAVKDAWEPPEKTSVQIIIHRPGVGPTPSVPIRSIHVGFDWNKGKVLIHPEIRLKEA